MCPKETGLIQEQEDNFDFDKYGSDLSKMKSREEIEKPRKSSRNPTILFDFKNCKEMAVRLLPTGNPDGESAFAGMPYFRIFQHWNIGPGDSGRSLCPHGMSDKKEPCYICEYRKSLFETGDKIDEARAEKMAPKQNFLYQVIDREDSVWKEGDKGLQEAMERGFDLLGKPKVKILRIPWAAHSQILDYYASSDYGDLSHPINGLDILITKTGEGFSTRYSVKTRRHNSPIFAHDNGDPDFKMIKAAIEMLQNLEEHPFYKQPTYDETVAAQLGTEVAAKDSNARGALPVMRASEDTALLTAWKEMVLSNQEGGFPSKPMTAEEVASWGGWTVEEVNSNVPCYSKEPDHTDKTCHACPIKSPCAATFYQTNGGRYSIKAPVVKDVEKALPPRKPGAESTDEGKGTQSMEQFLRSRGA